MLCAAVSLSCLQGVKLPPASSDQVWPQRISLTAVTQSQHRLHHVSSMSTTSKTTNQVHTGSVIAAYSKHTLKHIFVRLVYLTCSGFNHIYQKIFVSVGDSVSSLAVITWNTPGFNTGTFEVLRF